MYSLISGAQKLRIPKTQFTNHLKLKRKEEQSVDSLILLRREDRGNKIPITESKCGTETEGMTFQRLPHLGIHPIYNHQTQTLLWMPTMLAERRLKWLSPERFC